MKVLEKKKNDFAPYNYLFNILISMNIYPNIENLEIKTNRKYKSVQDAIDNGKWQLNNFTEEEKEELYKYLEKNLRKNNEGMLENPNDKADWILIWWKKNKTSNFKRILCLKEYYNKYLKKILEYNI